LWFLANTVVKERLAGEVGHPMRMGRRGKHRLPSVEEASIAHLQNPMGSLQECWSEATMMFG
jgi:hypothetical protein